MVCSMVQAPESEFRIVLKTSKATIEAQPFLPSYLSRTSDFWFFKTGFSCIELLSLNTGDDGFNMSYQGQGYEVGYGFSIYTLGFSFLNFLIFKVFHTPQHYKFFLVAMFALFFVTYREFYELTQHL